MEWGTREWVKLSLSFLFSLTPSLCSSAFSVTRFDLVEQLFPLPSADREEEALLACHVPLQGRRRGHGHGRGAQGLRLPPHGRDGHVT